MSTRVCLCVCRFWRGRQDHSSYHSFPLCVCVGMCAKGDDVGLGWGGCNRMLLMLPKLLLLSVAGGCCCCCCMMSLFAFPCRGKGTCATAVAG